MNKIITLSLTCTMALYAVDLGTIDVTEVTDSKIMENVSNEDVKSADLAEALYKAVPSINLIRRSGIANDITLRGQKRDNIVVTVDDAKVFGACPNRMDPPTSHIVASNVESVTVSEGPFDVEEFGALSGSVKVTTKEPTKDFKGEVETTVGSFDYKKIGAKVSGGNDKVKILASVSAENSGQYEDGDGNTIAQQLKNATDGTPYESMQYQDKYEDMDAFLKKTAMLKAFVNIDENQKLQTSATFNRSDNILYGNSKMDAIYDNSDIYNLKYTVKDLSKYSKKLTIKTYFSDVTQPMSTKYRKSSGTDSVNEVISKLTTAMAGFKAINEVDEKLQIGVDVSNRNWDGAYTGYGSKAGVTGKKSIDDVNTLNQAVFAKYNTDVNKLHFKFGARYNGTAITTADSRFSQRDFFSLDANLVTTLKVDEDLSYFLAVGRASRVPDARELYFVSSTGVMAGTPNLKQVSNNEIDVGFEKKCETGYVKLKTFYSQLNDYIYFHKGKPQNNFENIDATIYGLELSASKDLDENNYVDFGVSYKVGKKDKALDGQSDTDLADISPLKINVALNTDLDDTTSSKIELIHADAWRNYDEDNGEQYLPSYTVINLKVKKEFSKTFEMSGGIDNVFNETYAVSNTYADLLLLSDGNTGEVMLLNEPGRYFYANLKYKF